MQKEITELRNQVRTLKRIVCLVCCLFVGACFTGCQCPDSTNDDRWWPVGMPSPNTTPTGPTDPGGGGTDPGGGPGGGTPPKGWIDKKAEEK